MAKHNYATLRPLMVTICDDEWGSVFGRGKLMQLHGGTELEPVSSTQDYHVFRINDVYQPKLLCRVQNSAVGTILTQVKPNSGRRTGHTVDVCAHPEAERETGCMYCWYRYWSKLASAFGLEVPPVIHNHGSAK
jgi:hypothetical protein